jgi:hypothetical protein
MPRYTDPESGKSIRSDQPLTNDEIAQAFGIAKGNNGNKPPSPKPETPNPYLHAAGALGGGINKGIAETAGTPVDVVNFILSKLGLGSKEPFGGSKSIAKILPERTKPEGLGENILSAMGEQGAAMLPFAGQATKGKKLIEGISDLLKVVTRAGTASGISRTVAPGNELLDTISQVVGGLSPNVIKETIPRSVETNMAERAGKFSTTLKPEERLKRINTSLDEGIRFTKGGLEKSKGIVKSINEEIKSKIKQFSAEGRMIDKNKVIKPAEAMKADVAENHPFPKKPVSQIQKEIDEYMAVEKPNMKISVKGGEPSVAPKLKSYKVTGGEPISRATTTAETGGLFQPKPGKTTPTKIHIESTPGKPATPIDYKVTGNKAGNLTADLTNVKPKNEVGIAKGQTHKQTINKELDDFYDAIKRSPDRTSAIVKQWPNRTKAKIADGLRAEISEIFPEVKGLNEREGALIGLNKSLFRAVNNLGNLDRLSVKGAIGLFIHPKYFLVNYVLNNRTVQSSLAVAIRQARNNPRSAGAVAGELTKQISPAVQK